MRNYQYRERPAEKVKVLKECICDLCGKKSTDQFDDPEKYGNYCQVTIEMKRGCYYPEMHNYTRSFYDICPDCFETKVIKFLNNEGAAISEEDGGW